MTKYEVLVNILDQIRSEAPGEFKTYYPEEDDKEKMVKARSLAFIHLFINVKFGITSFVKRHQLITDGPFDGGLDAYFVDNENKKIYLLQSKFRSNETNFCSKSIDANDLVRMEISRILKGESTDSNGNEFNSKIKSFQEVLARIRDIARYDYVVIILGNTKLNDEQIRRLMDNFDPIIYDYERTYKELVFPLCAGVHFSPEDIIISINLKEKEQPKLRQTIKTDYGDYVITIIFVPTKEIGRVMYKYKNAILKYNPRNFLSLSKNVVNKGIRESILKYNSNNFAILNNGITLIADRVQVSESTGRTNEGQLILSNPQIINGGQTAYTLSTVYSEFINDIHSPLDNKEVMLKIITLVDSENEISSDFVKLISNSTNQQSEVLEADRRSNTSIQIKLQELFFNNFGLFYERKIGEFHDGVINGYIDEDLIINRTDFLKSYYSYLGNPSSARRSNEKSLFKEEKFQEILENENQYITMIYSYLVFKELASIESRYKKVSDSYTEFGNALIYGKFAVISAIGLRNDQLPKTLDGLIEKAELQVKDTLAIWRDFEDFVALKNKDTKYFNLGRKNYDMYYKVSLLDTDCKEYFGRNEIALLNVNLQEAASSILS